MKKVIYFICLAAIGQLFFNSCSKQLEVPEQAEEPLKVVFSVNDIICDPQTKTTLDGTSFKWSANDTVGIYPNAGAQIFFSMQEGAGTNSAVFDGGGWGFRQGYVYYSYYPFIEDYHLDRNHIPVSYSGQRQNGATNLDHFGKYDYMYAPGTSSSGNEINFSYHHLSCIITIHATKLPAGTYKQLTLTAPSALFTDKGYFDLEAKSPAVVAETSSKELSLVLDNVTLAEGADVYFYFISAPVDLSDKNITVSILDSQKKQYDCVKTPSKPYVAGTQYPLGCSVWNEVPQSVGVVIDDWGEGGQYAGGAE